MVPYIALIDFGERAGDRLPGLAHGTPRQATAEWILHQLRRALPVAGVKDRG
jgi:hypothetical protein